MLKSLYYYSGIGIAYVADNAQYMPAENTKDLLESVESTTCRFLKWFSNNWRKGNGDKCHVSLKH